MIVIQGSVSEIRDFFKDLDKDTVLARINFKDLVKIKPEKVNKLKKPSNSGKPWSVTDRKILKDFVYEHITDRGILPQGKPQEIADILGRSIKAVEMFKQRYRQMFKKWKQK